MSDEDTVEFEIEVVTSSSGVSLADMDVREHEHEHEQAPPAETNGATKVSDRHENAAATENGRENGPADADGVHRNVSGASCTPSAEDEAAAKLPQDVRLEPVDQRPAAQVVGLAAEAHEVGHQPCEPAAEPEASVLVEQAESDGAHGAIGLESASQLGGGGEKSIPVKREVSASDNQELLDRPGPEGLMSDKPEEPPGSDGDLIERKILSNDLSQAAETNPIEAPPPPPPPPSPPPSPPPPPTRPPLPPIALPSLPSHAGVIDHVRDEADEKTMKNPAGREESVGLSRGEPILAMGDESREEVQQPHTSESVAAALSSAITEDRSESSNSIVQVEHEAKPSTKCQLVTELSPCPDGWSLVDKACELQIEEVEKSASLTSIDFGTLHMKEAEHDEHRVASVGTPLKDGSEAQLFETNEIDSGPEAEMTVEPLVEASPLALHVAACEHETPFGQDEPDRVQAVDTPALQAVGPLSPIAAPAPQVIILGQAGESFSDYDPASHSPMSVERQDGSNDEAEAEQEVDESLADREEEEDLEREFDEEPEFERRDVVVKRNKSPRDEYELGAELGRGKFGTVFRCTEMASGRQLAAKFIAMRRREDREDVEREVAIMSALQHRRLLQLYDAFDDGREEMCLITELVEGGELFERIVDDDFELTEKKAAIFVRQICEGVEYMHSKQIVHLDMKPENILCLSRTGIRIKLIDFGLARRLDPNNPLRVMFGTPDFAAPEVLGYEIVTLATDMWSVGVICYVLLSGLSPFMGESDLDTMANVTRATYDFDDRAFEPISELAKDFIRKLLLRNPAERLEPAECLKHPWLQRGGALLEAAVRERRESSAPALGGHLLAIEQFAATVADMMPAGALQHHRASFGGESTASSGLISLDKRRLKRYVVRRKWHKTVHAIMALNRMGANLNKLTE